MGSIRPLQRVFADHDAVVLEVAVESAVGTFTWVVLSSGNEPVALRTTSRGERAGDGVAGSGEQAAITVVVGDRCAQGQPRPDSEDDESAGDPLRLAVDDYQLRLYKGRPAKNAKTVKGMFGRLEVLDEDTFSIASVRREGPPTYTRLSELLDEDGSYDAVVRAARDLVGSSTVRPFADVLPGGDATIANVPGVELIWNYWLEEGMLVQTLKVILARFQNRRLSDRNPLSRFEVTPLRPLRNKLWGHAADKPHRLTVRRRAMEYEYEYGLRLSGPAGPRRQAVVERRSGFVEAFHRVLFQAHVYFKDLDDLTVQADAFPLYLALRDCHLVLSQGSHNQYGELAAAARAEFLVMQDILAEPEMREVLGGPAMTPYPELWMDRVDTMKRIQGWHGPSIIYFNDLATVGEQLVLTLRLGNWAAPGTGAAEAATWAQAFRTDIQLYAASYRTVTGVDVSREPGSGPPRRENRP